MSDVQTKVSDLINPQVMGDMVSAELTNKIKFTNIAVIDETLAARPGNTITVPTYAYIGVATDLAEGVAGETVALTATSATATVKKAFKGVELTDEAVLAGYGDPIGETAKQLAMSLADKIDVDLATALSGVASPMIYSPSTKTIISYANVVNAMDLFQDEDQGEDMYVIIHPAQLTQLRLDSNFTPASAMGDRVIETGVVGMIAGAKVMLSKKVALVYVTGTSGAKKYVDFIVKPGALTVYLKRGVQVEVDRNIKAKTTIVTADEHYATVLSNTAKAVKFDTLEVAAG